LKVEVVSYELKRPIEAREPRPSFGFPVFMGQPMKLHPERRVPLRQGVRLRSTAEDGALRGTEAAETGIAPVRGVQLLKSPFCTRCAVNDPAGPTGRDKRRGEA